MAQARSVQAINRGGKNEDPQCGPRKQGSIVCLTSSGTISIHEEWLQISEAGLKQKESI